jgi:hypothetical protein
MKMSLQDYRKKIESEPDAGGFYLKPADVKVGDMFLISKAEIMPAKELQPKKKGDPVITIPEKILATGQLILAGTTAPQGQDVQVNISKAQAKKLFALWKDADWVGKKIMVTSVVTKPIQGESRTWIEWTGLP